MTDTSSLTTQQQEIIKILVASTSKEKPMPTRTLAKRIIKGEAYVRKNIDALRALGWPICATTKGYFYARNYAELDEFIRNFENGIDYGKAILYGLKKSYENVGDLALMKVTNEPVQKKVWVKQNGMAKEISVPIDESGKPVIPPNVQPL